MPITDLGEASPHGSRRRGAHSASGGAGSPQRQRPRVSVVIPTYRRPGLLRRCLRALEQQQFDLATVEVIVVEDGGEGHARTVVDEARRRGRLYVRYLAVPKRGPAAARNAGVELARADVIAFTDDDAIPTPGWLREGLRALTPEVDAVAGRTTVPIDGMPTDYQRSVRGLETSPFLTCNLVCRLDRLIALGGFDARFASAYREDSDLQFRLHERGATVVRNARMLVEHPVRPAPRFISLRLQRNQFYDALLYRKHPAAFRNTIRRSPPWRYYLITLCQLATLGALGLRKPAPATLATVVWLSLTAKFCADRLRPVRKTPADVLELIVTSILIPPVAIYWRVRGAFAFRTWFF